MCEVGGERKQKRRRRDAGGEGVDAVYRRPGTAVRVSSEDELQWCLVEALRE